MYIYICIYIYKYDICAYSQAQQKSHVHLIREPLEILGDIRTGCTALIQFRFGSDFPEEARNITMLPKCCIKTLSPSAKKNILDFRSQNKGCYRGILYIIVCSLVFVPLSPVSPNQRTFLPAMEVHRRELGCGGIHHMDVPQSHDLRVQVVPRFGIKMGSPFLPNQMVDEHIIKYPFSP